MQQVAEGKLDVKEITPTEWKSMSPEMLIELQKSGKVQSVLDADKITGEMVGQKDEMIDFMRKNNLTAHTVDGDHQTEMYFPGSTIAYDGQVGAVTGKTYLADETVDPKDAVDGQVVIFNGIPYKLNKYVYLHTPYKNALNQTRHSDYYSLSAINLKTGREEVLAQTG